MGDFSSRCVISNLPITSCQKVVGFELEPYRYPDSFKHKFIPASWPIFGEYDNSGGIEGFNNEKPLALIHFDIWKNAKAYWHKENNKNGLSNWFDFEKAKEEAFKEKEMWEKYNLEKGEPWTDTDYLYYKLRDYFNQTDYGLVFRNLIDGIDVSGHSKKYCFLTRNAFMEDILNKILKNEWGKTEQDILNKFVFFYSGEMVIGNAIRPSNDIYMEQYPDYVQRIKLLKFHLKVAEKLQTEQNKWQNE